MKPEAQPRAGAPAPDFELLDAEGAVRRLADFRGSILVLYFYPADDTPGCTKEACAFRDVYSEIRRRGAVVVGVSPDDHASHARFRDKYSLPFPLLADPDKKAIEAYGVWGERVRSDGSRAIGVLRTTFVIDAAGTILRVFPNVDPQAHAAEILALL